MIARLKFDLHLPADFEDSYALEKGYYSGARLSFGGRTYSLTFYDPVRLAQDVSAEQEHGAIFFEPNLVVVERVDRKRIEAAALWLVQTGQVKLLAELT